MNYNTFLTPVIASTSIKSPSWILNTKPFSTIIKTMNAYLFNTYNLKKNIYQKNIKINIYFFILFIYSFDLQFFSFLFFNIYLTPLLHLVSCPLTVNMALVYDGVQLLAETFKHVMFRAESLNCNDDSSWDKGYTVVNYMKSVRKWIMKKKMKIWHKKNI